MNVQQELRGFGTRLQHGGETSGETFSGPLGKNTKQLEGRLYAFAFSFLCVLSHPVPATFFA